MKPIFESRPREHFHQSNARTRVHGLSGRAEASSTRPLGQLRVTSTPAAIEGEGKRTDGRTTALEDG